MTQPHAPATVTKAEIVLASLKQLLTIPRPRILCKDGASISVQANSNCYCSPRNDTGPYTHVEVGYPSHPFPEAVTYKEDFDADDCDTIFAYVPIELVETWIYSHGGFAPIESEK